jgi:hypothetical protein
MLGASCVPAARFVASGSGRRPKCWPGASSLLPFDPAMKSIKPLFDAVISL